MDPGSNGSASAWTLQQSTTTDDIVGWMKQVFFERVSNINCSAFAIGTFCNPLPCFMGTRKPSRVFMLTK